MSAEHLGEKTVETSATNAASILSLIGRDGRVPANETQREQAASGVAEAAAEP